MARYKSVIEPLVCEHRRLVAEADRIRRAIDAFNSYEAPALKRKRGRPPKKRDA